MKLASHRILINSLTALGVTATLAAAPAGPPVRTRALPLRQGMSGTAERALEFLKTGAPLEVPRSKSKGAGTGDNFGGVSVNMNLTPGTLKNDGGETETSVAVGYGTTYGKYVVVAYNDASLYNGGFSGYSSSTDGGKSFTRAKSMPQGGMQLLGDPVLDSDPNYAGVVYFASLCSGGA